MNIGAQGALRHIVWSGLIPFLLAGCAGDMPRDALSEKPRVAKLSPLVMPENAIGLENDGDDIISTHGRPVLMATALDDSDPLPTYLVPWVSFVDAPLQDVVQAVVANAHLALSVVWDNPTAKVNRRSVTMTNLSGDLTKVLNKLAESYGFYWRYKDGTLHISPDRQYITQVPPIAELFESLPIMVRTLGGVDVFLDKSARMLTFRAGSQAFSQIKGYLQVMREDRALIVYDTYIWEVVLNDKSQMGVDWSAMPGSTLGTNGWQATTTPRLSGQPFISTAAVSSGARVNVGPKSALDGVTGLLTAGLVNAASGGTGLALAFAGSQFSMNVLLDFLRSQGNINSLSQPKIQLLSGGKATLKDEISTTYVSRVGNPTISGGTVVPGEVETSQVNTGVTLEVTGDASDGTIYSDIAIKVSDLLGMGSATVSGSTISLPQTSSREVKTHVRAKPGDTILLAGIQYDKLNGTTNNGMGIGRSKQMTVERSELVIVMKPRIKHFVPQGTEIKAAAASPAAPITPPVSVAPSLPATQASIPVAPTAAPVKAGDKPRAVAEKTAATDNETEISRLKEDVEHFEAEARERNSRIAELRQNAIDEERRQAQERLYARPQQQ